ncbi:hypothetical protein PIPA1_14150 [Pelosinus sp. IPA-1]|nr:hypothetical protein PIPA1_14150 [Pelosinus sp. IPA-1]
MPSPRTQAEALAVLTWNQESVILSDSVKKPIADAIGFFVIACFRLFLPVLNLVQCGCGFHPR